MNRTTATSWPSSTRSSPTGVGHRIRLSAWQHMQRATLVNVTLPVFNEEARLLMSIPKLHEFLSEHCRFKFEIVIADNASTDRTLDVARRFSYSEVRVVHLDQKGR